MARPYQDHFICPMLALLAPTGENQLLQKRCYAIELAFREVVGVTVVDYIRTRRLNRARQLLLSQKQSRNPVTEAAIQSGLFHLGHFSRDYKQLFGEAPSQTLKWANCTRR